MSCRRSLEQIWASIVLLVLLICDLFRFVQWSISVKTVFFDVTVESDTLLLCRLSSSELHRLDFLVVTIK